MVENKCKGDHKVHICELASQNKHDQIKVLADDPNYMCLNCGRVANSAENLCNPTSFDKIALDVPLG